MGGRRYKGKLDKWLGPLETLAVRCKLGVYDSTERLAILNIRALARLRIKRRCSVENGDYWDSVG